MFANHIIDIDIKAYYISFLSSNFLDLGIHAIYDFVFNEWINPSKEDIDSFMKKMLESQKKQTNGLQPYPDPIETKLECIYLLYITDIIDDISTLNEISTDRPHLQFLLSPNTFDYTKVDFSNYMWENFARRPRFMKFFIEHKDQIVPNIQEKLKKGTASETEKRILFGYMLKDEEIWEV